MRSHPLLIGVPAFAAGALLVAGLSSVARADPQLKSSGDAFKTYGGTAQVRSVAKAPPRYRIANDEQELNRYAAQGYDFKVAASTSTTPIFLMERAR